MRQYLRLAFERHVDACACQFRTGALMSPYLSRLVVILYLSCGFAALAICVFLLDQGYTPVVRNLFREETTALTATIAQSVKYLCLSLSILWVVRAGRAMVTVPAKAMAPIMQAVAVLCLAFLMPAFLDGLTSFAANTSTSFAPKQLQATAPNAVPF
jgi:hypothetical protein